MMDFSKFKCVLTKTVTFNFLGDCGEECLEAFKEYMHRYYPEAETVVLTEDEYKQILKNFIYDNDGYLENLFYENVEVEADIWKQEK